MCLRHRTTSAQMHASREYAINCALGIFSEAFPCSAYSQNATLLGIHDISDISLENGIPNGALCQFIIHMLLVCMGSSASYSVSFTSSHPLSDSTSPCLNFVSLELVYAWVTTPKGASEDNRDPDAISPSKLSANPINSQCINPFASLLDQVVRRLFSHHILRYITSSTWISR